MPTQLAEDARRRLEAGQGDLRDRCWHNVQRLHKWSGKLEREGPSGEDADYYESMGPRSLFLGPIVWDGPTDKRKLGWDEITAALRAKVRDLLGRYARELAALAGKVFVQLIRVGAEEVGSFLEREIRALGLPNRLPAEIAGIGPNRLLAGRADVEFHGHQPFMGRGQKKRACGRRNRRRMKRFHRIRRKPGRHFPGLPDHNIMPGNQDWRGFGLCES